MIIDMHSHLGDPWYGYWKKNIDVEDHLASMEKYGIDKRCISWWQAHNAPDEGNVVISNVVKKYPEKFLGFAVINPRWQQDAVDEVKKAREELGMVGLKFHPAACQYHSDSPCLDKVMQKGIEMEFPMLFHCGCDEYSHPHNLGKLASKYPEATIIMAHMGEEAWFEGITTAGVNPNIILDTTGSFNWFRILNFAIESVGEDRIVFGMDFPAYNPGPELAKITEADITSEQKEKILWKNAARILNI
jgi:uncharacterized protein